jgi:hypothetical protein
VAGSSETGLHEAFFGFVTPVLIISDKFQGFTFWPLKKFSGLAVVAVFLQLVELLGQPGHRSHIGGD